MSACGGMTIAEFVAWYRVQSFRCEKHDGAMHFLYFFAIIFFAVPLLTTTNGALSIHDRKFVSNCASPFRKDCPRCVHTRWWLNTLSRSSSLTAFRWR